MTTNMHLPQLRTRNHPHSATQTHLLVSPGRPRLPCIRPLRDPAWRQLGALRAVTHRDEDRDASPTAAPAAQPAIQPRTSDADATSSRDVTNALHTVSSPPQLTVSVLLDELRTGQLLPNAKRAFPKVPWGPTQLAQVVAWSAALAVAGVTTAAQTPQVSALGSDPIQAAAVRHLGLELFCMSLACAVLFMGLRKSKPMSAGHFRYDVSPGVVATVAAIAAVSYPLADPVLYDAWRSVEQAILPALGFPPDALPDSGAALVGQLREAAGAGASGALAMHLTASCVVGPLWEETFWRGFFLASMTKVLPLPACVALSSSAFALLHLGPGNLLPIFMLSAVCDLLYLRTASLAAPLVFHAGWNAYQLLGIVLLGKESFV